MPVTLKRKVTEKHDDGTEAESEITLKRLAHHPAKTTFHVLGHIELGHTSEAVHDSDPQPQPPSKPLPRPFRL